ncbi:NDP-sugar synthase [uncultured Ruthenibacterium sp.]|uniref:nucleotidyltransferase family protein n=1 Tax=uncultured Ruthenibacterium sp. TaxID=1905347 RepID=UPI00349E8098
MKKPILVVMAAGMGSRYGGLKQIDPVGANGEAILDYSLFDARRAGFETVVFIIKHEIEEDFLNMVGKRIEKSGMEIRYAFQQLDILPPNYTVPEGRVKPWGTSHAILSAAEQIDAPFAVINADDYYGPEAFKVIYDYLSTHADDEKYEYAMVGYQLQNTVTDNGHVARGICVTDSEGYLDSVTERTRIEKYAGGIHFSTDDGETWTDVPGETTVSMNLWGFTPSFVQEAKDRFAAFLDKALVENPLKGEYFLPSVVSELIAENKARVRVLTSSDKWYGVTYKADKPVVMQAIAEKTSAGLYPAPLWK